MGLEAFNKASRPGLFREVEEGTFDLLVIGGGITGACIFRDAALRGLRVALFEARDFASGTSSRSSKLIHGGLRYLKTLGFRMARESCRERNLHIRLNKRLVRPIPFLMPLYRGKGESQTVIRVGMALYEILSDFANSRIHRFIDREETLSMAPALLDDGLVGGCLYYDAIVSDNRWTLEAIKEGVRSGGIALNYAPVTAFLKKEGKITGAKVRDTVSGGEHQVSARSFVNAAGVFADRVRQLDDPRAKPMIRLSKGTHLVFNEEDVPLSVTTCFSSPVDGRPLFLVKRDGCFLYGTTDDWEDADPGEPVPGARDVGYLLRSLDAFMPDSGLDASRVQFVYSGFRPLLTAKGAPGDPATASREDRIEEAPSGLISIFGGKMTTARLMAARVLRRVIAHIDPRGEFAPCRTDRVSLGGTNEEVTECLAKWVKRCPQLTGYFRTLCNRFGLDADAICEGAMDIYLGRHPDPHAEPIRAEVQYVCRHEMTCTVEDLLDRRAGFLYWNPGKRLERLRHGAQVIREELALSEEEFEEQFEAYREHLRRFHTLPREMSRQP